MIWMIIEFISYLAWSGLMILYTITAKGQFDDP